MVWRTASPSFLLFCKKQHRNDGRCRYTHNNEGQGNHAVISCRGVGHPCEGRNRSSDKDRQGGQKHSQIVHPQLSPSVFCQRIISPSSCLHCSSCSKSIPSPQMLCIRGFRQTFIAYYITWKGPVNHPAQKMRWAIEPGYRFIYGLTKYFT